MSLPMLSPASSALISKAVDMIATALVAGIGLLIAAGVALYTNWQPISKFFTDLWETIKGISKSFSDMASLGIIDLVTKGMGAIGLGDNTVNMAPATATTAIRNNTVQNTPVAVHVNVADGRVKSVETSGGTKANVSLNNGKQN